PQYVPDPANLTSGDTSEPARNPLKHGKRALQGRTTEPKGQRFESSGALREALLTRESGALSYWGPVPPAVGQRMGQRALKSLRSTTAGDAGKFVFPRHPA